MDYTKILQTYSLEEIIEWNDVPTEELLEFLVENGLLQIPNPRPLMFEDD